MKKSIFFINLLLTCLYITPAQAEEKIKNAYTQSIFVANKESYKPTLATEPQFINGWGVAIRPAGAGGHFWVTAKDVSYEYVGDVSASADETLRTLHQDKLATVKLPVGGKENFSTGVVFIDSKNQFMITQHIESADPITAPAKFLFASDGGIISAWTERKKEDGSFDRPVEAISVIDESKQGAQFFGIAVNKDYSRIYAADFGASPSIKIYGSDFKPLNISFDMPFDTNKNGKVDPGEYAPFNVQALTTPKGESHIFVTYAKTQSCPAEEIAKDTCKKGELFVGEEDTSKEGYGRVAEFTEDGKLVAVLKDAGKLSAPWGIAYAPQNFGKLSGALLVGNFGSGTIAAYDAETGQFIDYMRDTNGKPIVIDKLWGFLFGNGQSLGDSNALYFAAGPDDEKDGIFGVIRAAAK